MATLALVVSLAALIVSSSGQSNDERVWSSVAYIYHGERTPARGGVSTTPSLTPFGAQQMFAQGSAFRARYLVDDNTTDESVATSALIQAIEPLALDNSQTSAISTNDSYISTGAIAFMQGLYLPANLNVAQSAGGLQAAVLANGSIIEAPLNGYQYPSIETLSTLDPDFIWINGQATCAKYEDSTVAFNEDPAAIEVHDESLAFYQGMWESIFSDAFPQSMANFFYASDLYQYAAYKWNHDNETHTKMNATDLATLAMYAGLQQQDLNGDIIVDGVGQGDMISAVAGRTLAAKIVASLDLNMASEGSSNKLNLMFGSFEPMIAFFALAGLVDGPSGADFEPLPDPGAAMVFELFSTGGNGSYPEIQDLWVRFLYRNSTLPDARFVEYALIGYGNSQSVLPYSDFTSGMLALSLDSYAEWCDTCGTTNSFCAGVASDSDGSSDSSSNGGSAGSSSGRLDPVVAGAIGAAVTCGVVGLLLAVAIMLGFVRLASSRERRGSSALGGFKGAEKMASDNDLSYAKGGVRRERVRSWELRDGAKAAEEGVAAPVHAGAVVDRVRPAASTTGSADDDANSVMGAAPVEPRQSI